MGRKPRYATAKEMQAKIEEYFVWCEGRYLKDKETGELMLTKQGSPIIIGAHPKTVTGLARALGFKTRKSLLEYQAKKEFQEVIEQAKLEIEQYVEEQLFTRDGVKGAMFSLQNNFGWKDDAKAEEGTQKEIVVVELTRRKAEATPDANEKAEG